MAIISLSYRLSLNFEGEFHAREIGQSQIMEERAQRRVLMKMLT
jgi:hypothetical protein